MVIVKGLNVDSRSYIESLCPGCLIELLSKTQNEVWDFSEKLAWETYTFEQANETFRYPTQGKSVVPATPSHHDYFVDSNDPYYYYMPPVLCDYCESSYHDAHTL